MFAGEVPKRRGRDELGIRQRAHQPKGREHSLNHREKRTHADALDPSALPLAVATLAQTATASMHANSYRHPARARSLRLLSSLKSVEKAVKL